MVDGKFNKRPVTALPILTNKKLIAQAPTSYNYTIYTNVYPSAIRFRGYALS